MSLANKAYEDLKSSEYEARKVFVKLEVLINTVAGFEDQKGAVNKKWNDLSKGVAIK